MFEYKHHYPNFPFYFIVYLYYIIPLSLLSAKMARTIFLIVFSNGTKPAHWAIWIPTAGQQDLGKLLHVTGNPATGFFLEFKRNYDLSATARTYQILSLAQVHDQYVADTPNAQGVDTTARDRLESTATVVAPPGRSANPFDPAVSKYSNNGNITIIDTLHRLQIARIG